MNEDNFDQLEFKGASQKEAYFSILESILFVSGDAIRLKEVASILECSDDFAANLLKELMLKYEAEDRGLKLLNINNTFQLVTKPKNSDYVQKLLKSNIRQSLSQAALETLSIIAYRQPVTRIDIDEIRGVKSDRAIATLLEKGLINECGRMEVAGRPILYSTTDEFLKYFDLRSLNEMPSLDNISYEEIQVERNE